MAKVIKVPKYHKNNVELNLSNFIKRGVSLCASTDYSGVKRG